MIEAGAREGIFEAVNRRLSMHGYIARGGQMTEASIVQALRQARLQDLPGLELNLRIKPRHRLVREKPPLLAVPTAINKSWSMGFIHDQLADGRSIRLFNAIDDYNRKGLGSEVDFSLPSERVIRSLDRIIEWFGKLMPSDVTTAPNTSAQ